MWAMMLRSLPLGRLVGRQGLDPSLQLRDGNQRAPAEAPGFDLPGGHLGVKLSHADAEYLGGLTWMVGYGNKVFRLFWHFILSGGVQERVLERC